MGPPILQMIKLLFDPDVSKKMILQLAYRQAKAVGFAKILGALLSTGIVGASSIIKIPQIKKITGPKSVQDRIKVAKGLSLPGISLESFVYLVHVVYNRSNNNPFLGYGETMLLGLQNIAIMLLINYYEARSRVEGTLLSERQKSDYSNKAIIKPFAAIVGAIVVLHKLPKSVVNGLQVLNIPLGIASKLPQIRKNHELKSTSHLSNVTVGANVVGSFIRVMTTVQNFDKLGRDYVLLAGYLSSFGLNSVIAGQCYYWRNDLKEKEKEE